MAVKLRDKGVAYLNGLEFIAERLNKFFIERLYCASSSTVVVILHGLSDENHGDIKLCLSKEKY